MLESILPEPQNYAGKVSATMTLNSKIDEHMSPVMDSVASKGRLQTQNLEIRNSKVFGTMADFLKNEKWRTPSPGALNIGFEIKDGRLWIEDPIVINISPTRMEIKGDQGLDMSMNYRLDATVPTSAIGSGATDILSKIPGGVTIKEIKVTGLIKGTVSDPDVSLSMADMATSVTTAVKEAVIQKVGDEVNRQINQIMAEAQTQADNLRSAGKQAADKVRREANASADKLVRDAASKNALEKKLAQTAADKLRSEGEANAKKLEQEADQKARAVLAAAQKKADDLKR
jgi:hypothetical protein